MGEAALTMRVGVIADTHGQLRTEAVDALRGCELIVHAGDVGRQEVLEGLRLIAPVLAVRGNVDSGAWAQDLPYTRVVAAGEVKLYVIHDVHQLRVDPAPDDCPVIISGHSHRASIEQRDGILFVNPGSAGPRRFNLPVTVALLEIEGRAVNGRLIALHV